MALSQNHLNHVCQYGQGKDQCRYLKQDSDDYRVFVCLKLSPVIKKKIDESVKVNKQLIRDKGMHGSYINTHIGFADNCPGYHCLKKKKQGYDVD